MLADLVPIAKSQCPAIQHLEAEYAHTPSNDFHFRGGPHHGAPYVNVGPGPRNH